MRLFILFLLITTAHFSEAQLGRHEQPIDTISIGGEEQENKMAQMEGHDQLKQELTGLRDSLSNFLVASRENVSRDSSDNDGKHMKSLAGYKERLDALIKKMQDTESDASLMKEGFVLLKETRQEFNKIRSAETR